MLIEAFDDLASRTDCQVFLTTHTPTLARRFSQTALRYVTWKDGQPIVHEGRNDETLAEIATSLGVLPTITLGRFLG
jgi:hypothetical protein